MLATRKNQAVENRNVTNVTKMKRRKRVSSCSEEEDEEIHRQDRLESVEDEGWVDNGKVERTKMRCKLLVNVSRVRFGGS